MVRGHVRVRLGVHWHARLGRYGARSSKTTHRWKLNLSNSMQAVWFVKAAQNAPCNSP